MALVRLTEAAIRKFPSPERGNKIHYDDIVRGFGLRVTCYGGKRFVLNYSFDGRERRMTIGSWPEWTAGAARERAKEMRRDIDAGFDPLEERRERREAWTFGELAAEYLAVHAARKADGGTRDAGYLRNDVLPVWRSTAARDIRRGDVLALVERKAVAAPVAANRLLAVVRRVFNFAIERELLDLNPAARVKAPGREVARERVLSADEIRALWRGVEGPGFSVPLAGVLRAILATAQRPGEVAGMRWAELDLAGGWWTIPAERVKSRRGHRVALNGVALELLAAVPRRSDVWVFASPARDAPLDVNALSHALRRNRERLGVDPFTAHDLRRTAASMMAAAGVPRFILARVLNHADEGVTRVYDRYSYDAEKRDAAELWGRELRAILGDPRATAGGSRVVAIR